MPAKAGAHVAEIVSFRLVKGMTDAAFLQAVETTRDYVTAAPGFVTRTLSKGADERWTDYVEWTGMDAAKAAGEAIMQAPGVEPFMSAIDPATVEMRHEAIHWRME